MFLSNLHRYFLLLILIAPISQACSGTSSNTSSNANIGELKSDFPFSTKEPETYQADFVVTIGTSEEHFFRARKGERSRIDIFKGSEISHTQMITDKTYTIDALRKVYMEEPIATGAVNAMPVFDPTNGFFAGREYTAFEETSRDGNTVKYRVKNADPGKGEILVSVDTSSGLMVRQEFLAQNREGETQPNVIFELRNVRLDVEDGVFQLPAGFRKVSKEEFRAAKPK